MITKQAPYEPISSEFLGSDLLISIKQAAEHYECCEGTLKANAKARRLRAFQAYFGAKVMVLPCDVEEFLNSRSDIASRFHPKISLTVPSAGLFPAMVKPKGYAGFDFPDEESQCGLIGDFGISVALRSINHAQPSEIARVANAFIEVGRQLLDLLPVHPPHTNP